jgi:hypothetical protein
MNDAAGTAPVKGACIIPGTKVLRQGSNSDQISMKSGSKSSQIEESGEIFEFGPYRLEAAFPCADRARRFFVRTMLRGRLSIHLRSVAVLALPQAISSVVYSINFGCGGCVLM